ncbi:MAG: hypothetical protein V1769_05585 [Thermoplasmatota archaeon]
MNNHEDRMPDPEKIKEILDIVAEKIPGLLKELSSLLYGPESAKKYAQAAATFFKELKAAGMNDQQAYDLTQQYMSTLNLGQMMKGFNVGDHHHG